MVKTIAGRSWMEVPEISLVFKPKIKSSQRPRVAGSEDIYKLLKGLWNPSLIELQEQARILLLNKNNRVLGIHTVSSGGISSLHLDPR